MALLESSVRSETYPLGWFAKEQRLFPRRRVMTVSRPFVRFLFLPTSCRHPYPTSIPRKVNAFWPNFFTFFRPGKTALSQSRLNRIFIAYNQRVAIYKKVPDFGIYFSPFLKKSRFLFLPQKSPFSAARPDSSFSSAFPCGARPSIGLSGCGKSPSIQRCLC